MKILINPEWYDLVKDLSAKHKSELLMCLLQYPDGDSKLGAWSFMKKQIDRDRQKYESQCKRLSENRQKRWADNQTDNRPQTDAAQQTAKSEVIVDSRDNENNNEKVKKDVSRLIGGLARDMNANAPRRYEITDELNLYTIDEIKDSLWHYNRQKLANAQHSLIAKRNRHKLTAEQIIAWIDNEGNFV